MGSMGELRLLCACLVIVESFAACSFLRQVSLENGMVLNYDARTLPSNLDTPSTARFTLSAHDGAASSIDVNPNIRGCIVTGGTDKLVKVWNITDEDNGKKNVSLVTSRDLGVVRVSLSAL